MGVATMRFATQALTRIKRAMKSNAPDSEIELPRDSRTDEVHVYNALWGIPPKLSGMPNSALRRINSFLEHGNPLSMTIITFDPDTAPKETRQRLLDTGRLRPEVEIVNVWQDLRNFSDDQLATFTGSNVTEQIPPAPEDREERSPTHAVFRDDETSEVIRRHHYRDDGTLLVTDLCAPGTVRRMILHTHDETPRLEWGQARELYNQWIERTVTQEPALVIVDDKRIGEFIHELSPRRFKLALFVHGSHLKEPATGDYGQYLPQRSETMRNLESFDLVAVQTQQQIDAIAARGIGIKKLRLLPSALPDSAYPDLPDTERDELAGAMIANLSKLKRVDHAIKAMNETRSTGHPATLTVCGTGPERDTLDSLIHELELSEAVTLAGQVTDVPTRLAASSFSLLTSTTEGLPLAILESMAAGCIPVVYDINYGPRDAITHGVNGYIAPYGDTDALAAQINEFLSLTPEAKNAMRLAAVERAKEFDTAHSYAGWKTALEAPVKAHDPKPFLDEEYLRVRDITVGPTGNSVRLSIVFADMEEVNNKNLRLVVAGRKRNTFFQAISTPDGWQRTDGRTAYNFTLSNDLFSQSVGQTFDVYIRKVGAKWDSKVRLKLPASFTKSDDGNLNWFRTEYGNFSVKVSAQISEDPV